MGRIVILEFEDKDTVIFDDIMNLLRHYPDLQKLKVELDSTLSFPGLEIYPDRRKIYRNRQEIHLTFPAIEEERFSVLYSDKALHLQYALHTTSFIEQPISDKTLSRFRKRYYDYETLHGVDLYHDCVKDLGDKTAKAMKLNGRMRRMDSMMIESNIRFLSRMELIYTCISKLVKCAAGHEPRSQRYMNSEEFSNYASNSVLV